MSHKNHCNLGKVLDNVQNTDEMLHELAEKSIVYLIEEGKMTKEKYVECVQKSATPNIQIEAYRANLITIDDISFTIFSDDDYQKLLSKTNGRFEISIEKFQQISKKLTIAFDKMKWTPNIVFSEGKVKVSIHPERVISSAVNSFNETTKSDTRKIIEKKIKDVTSFISENTKKFNPCYSTLLYTGAFAFTLSNALLRFNKWGGAVNTNSRNQLYGILFCVGVPMTFGGVFGKNNAMIASGFSLAISASYLETYYQLRYNIESLHALLQWVGYASICSGLYKCFMSS